MIYHHFLLFIFIIMIKKILLSCICSLILFWGFSFADSMNDLFTKGYNAYEDGNYEESVDYYLEYIETYPNSEDYDDALHNLYLSVKQLTYRSLEDWDNETAIEYWKIYMDYDEKDFYVLFNIGTAYDNLWEYDKAIEYYRLAKDNFDTDANRKKVSERIIELKNYVYKAAYSTSEIERAVKWMYDNWLTKYNNVDEFRWYDYLTRQEASKFFSLFAKNILGKKVNNNINVSYSDTKNADPTLQTYIIESSKLWLFQGNDGKFMPFNKLTKAQGITVLIRSIVWYVAESGDRRYSDYYNKAYNAWLTKGMGFDYNTLDSTNIKEKKWLYWCIDLHY